LASDADGDVGAPRLLVRFEVYFYVTCLFSIVYILEKRNIGLTTESSVDKNVE